MSVTYLSYPLALTLLVPWFNADHAHDAVASDDLAIAANLLHRCQYFHLSFSTIRRTPVMRHKTPQVRNSIFLIPGLLGAENDPCPGKVVWRQIHRHLVAREYLDVVHPHLSRNVTKYDVTVFQLHPERCIRQRFEDLSLHLYRFFFRHPFTNPSRNGSRRGPRTLRCQAEREDDARE
jgi:hypothetical protein